MKVLDKGEIILVDHMGNDLSVVRSARVSYDAEMRTGVDEGADEKLIRYLVANKHVSPLESVYFTFQVKAPIFVTRQWMRHRSHHYNEISARYSVLADEFYIPDEAVVGLQSKANKQQRSVDDENVNSKEFINDLRASCDGSYQTYLKSISNGIPRELARMLLPVNIYTKFFDTVNLRDLLIFLQLRLSPHAQYEIQQYAKAIIELIRPIVPRTLKAFEDLQMNTVQFTTQDLQYLSAHMAKTCLEIDLRNSEIPNLCNCIGDFIFENKKDEDKCVIKLKENKLWFGE